MGDDAGACGGSEWGLETFCQGLRYLMGFLVGILAIPVGMQVIARYTGIIPVYLWTEELSTFIFVWVVMIGSMVAVWEGTHFDVRVIPDANQPFMIFLQKAVVLILIGVFAVLFAWYGIESACDRSSRGSVVLAARASSTAWSIIAAGDPIRSYSCSTWL